MSIEYVNDNNQYHRKEKTMNESLEYLLSQDDKFKYQMLGRLQMDCEYYLGNGHRHNKHLWAGNVEEHIEDMYAIYDSFPDDAKPEWITREKIDYYKVEMSDDKEKMIKSFEGYELWRLQDCFGGESYFVYKDNKQFTEGAYFADNESAAEAFMLGFEEGFDEWGF